MHRSISISRCASGSSAVEFAVISPFFLFVLFSIISWGLYLGAAHAVQQIAADVARVTIAGLDLAERRKLASDYLQSKAVHYALVDNRRLKVTVEDDEALSGQFTVRLVYDASNLPIWNVMAFALPDHMITRSATIRLGGR